MSTETEQPLPAWTWRVLGGGAVGLLLLVIASIALISAGVFDPQPAGPLQQTLAPGAARIAPGQRAVTWLPQPAPQTPFSARLSARHTGGERDVAYGLALGEEGNTLVVALSPLGYVALWQELPGDERVEHLPWQTWPHVRRDGAANEIQVDVGVDTVSVRLNRELLWQAPLDLAPAAMGLYTESFGREAQVEFEQLGLFYEPPP